MPRLSLKSGYATGPNSWTAIRIVTGVNSMHINTLTAAIIAKIRMFALETHLLESDPYTLGPKTI